MKLKELVEKCRTKDYVTVVIRDKENQSICTTRANSGGILPYKDCEVLEWFPNYSIGIFKGNDNFCVILDYEVTEDEQ